MLSSGLADLRVWPFRNVCWAVSLAPVRVRLITRGCLISSVDSSWACARFQICFNGLAALEAAMPKFTVLSRKDAFIDYLAEVEAPDAQAAVDLAYDGG